MILASGAEFIATHARTLERRLFELAFRDGEPHAALQALLAYWNPDGGFGHALEPDLRVSSSQPIFIHFALSALREIGLPARQVGDRACSFLATIGSAPVPYALPDAMEHPRANHWNGDYALAPSLHATAGITAGLHATGAKHEWLDRATAWCLDQIEGTPAYTGHTLLNVLDLLQHAPGDHTALRERATARLFEADYVMLETPVTTYGLTPLHFATTPASPLRSLFADDVVEAHLDDLQARQQPDGGWPIHWTPPAGAATNEWRGRWTLEGLRTLRAYGRI